MYSRAKRLEALEKQARTAQAQHSETRFVVGGAEYVQLLWNGKPTYTVLADLWDAWPAPGTKEEACTDM